MQAAEMDEIVKRETQMRERMKQWWSGGTGPQRENPALIGIYTQEQALRNFVTVVRAQSLAIFQRRRCGRAAGVTLYIQRPNRGM